MRGIGVILKEKKTIDMKNGQQKAHPFINKNGDAEQGLTKREYVSAMAMQALIQGDKYSDRINPEHLAKKSILYADELLKQLGNE